MIDTTDEPPHTGVEVPVHPPPRRHRRRRRWQVTMALLSLIGGVAAGLALGAVGSTGLGPAVASGSVMGVTAAAVTAVVLRRTAVEVDPRVVSTEIPGLREDRRTMWAAALGWSSRPDPFEVGWDHADGHPVLGQDQLRQWEHWAEPPSPEAVVASVWRDRSRRGRRLRRRLTNGADPERPAAEVTGPHDPRSGEADVGDPLELRFPPISVELPDLAPWPDAPWHPR